MTVTRKVSEHNNLGTLQEGDVVLGERVSGTTGLFTVPSLAGSGGSGAVDSVNAQTGVVVLDADDISDAATTNKFTNASDVSRLTNTSGTNTGDQTSIVGITGTKAQFDTAVTDGNFLYVGDVTTPNVFGTIAVSGQSDVVADSSTDTLTLVAGSNITITTDATTDSITISAGGGSSVSPILSWMI